MEIFKYIFCIGVYLVILISGSNSNQTLENFNGKDCIYTNKNSTWMKDCNSCSCLENGQGMCTSRGCLTQDNRGGSEHPPKCSGSASWRRGSCEWCECVDGKGECRSIQCDNQLQKSGEDLIGKSCLYTDDESRWRKSCNWCHCTSTNTGICTIRGCPKNFDNTLGEDAPDCEGTASWRKDNCTWCKCVNRKAQCDNTNCGKRTKQLTKPGEPNCVPISGSAGWKDKCNWCQCIEPGFAGCTRKLCIPGITKASSIECEGNPKWRNRAGDWCKCNKGKAICAPPDSKTDEANIQFMEDSCTEGKSWIEVCNTCVCKNLQIVCTDLDCTQVRSSFTTDALSDLRKFVRHLVKITINSLNGLKCKRGSRWSTQDCKHCDCSQDEMAIQCTKSYCMSAYRYQANQCSDNSVWTDDCNTCVCPYGVPICTDMDCKAQALARAPLDEVDTVSPPPANVNCIQGSTWFKDCNRCSCVAGQDFCTQIACTAGDEEPNQKVCDNASQWRTPQCEWCTCVNETAICVPHKCSGAEEPTGGDQDSPPQSAPIIDAKDGDCTRGSEWKEGCNWCNCISGIAVCNLAVCLPADAQRDDKQCKGDSQWRLDSCTWCTCINGTGNCVQDQRCARGISLVRRVVGCKHGNNWISGCDLCTCIHGIASCIKRSCTHTADKCSSTKRQGWEENCKRCRCIDGIKYCLPKVANCTEKVNGIPKYCFEPGVEPGAKYCGSFEMKWSYNALKGQCKQIVFEGCGGSPNLFQSEQECLHACRPIRPRSFRGLVASSKVGRECGLRMDRGPCHAHYKRYAFHQEMRQCIPFDYSGCLGNDNNFLSAKQCYDTCGGHPPIANFECDRRTCPWQRFGHYFWKNCKPIYEGGSCCPVSFECRNYRDSLSPEKCYYKKQEYSLGDHIPVEDECYRGCRCIDSYVPGQRAEIRCAEVECPEFFEQRPDPNCKKLYKVGECCPYTLECPDPTQSISAREPTCRWNGRSWNAGERMYFKEAPCLMCICTPEFTTIGGHGCQTIDCGFDFRHRRKFAKDCTPIYFENDCCPVDWICPGEHQIQILTSKRQPNEDTNCFFGTVTIPLGSHVKVNDCKVECHCQAPPELSCLIKRSCKTTTPARTEISSKQNESSSCKPNCRPEVSKDGKVSCICDKTLYKCPPVTCPDDCTNQITYFNFMIGCDTCMCIYKDSRIARELENPGIE